MGPQLYRCGNGNARSPVSDSRALLQWGRNFIVAETVTDSSGDGIEGVLQWGRNFIVAETLHERCVACGAWSFNGAATLSLRKPSLYYY